MELHLSGRRALVTGASGAIGEAIATTLAVEGASVVAHGVDKERVEQVVATISASGGQASAAAADLTSDDAVTRLADEIATAGDGVDILVNCAGDAGSSTWWTATAADWIARWDVNVVSAVRLIRALVPSMRHRGFGRVIQISTGLATQPYASMPDYSATKAAMVNLTTSLARELAGSGVTVNTVSPGIIVTPGVQALFRSRADASGWGTSWPEIEAGVLRDVLPNSVGRLGRVEEVADLVAFLASARADYVTGANYRVDGGSTTSIN